MKNNPDKFAVGQVWLLSNGQLAEVLVEGADLDFLVGSNKSGGWEFDKRVPNWAKDKYGGFCFVYSCESPSTEGFSSKQHKFSEFIGTVTRQ